MSVGILPSQSILGSGYSPCVLQPNIVSRWKMNGAMVGSTGPFPDVRVLRVSRCSMIALLSFPDFDFLSR